MSQTLLDNRGGLDQLRIQPQNAPRVGTGMLVGYITTVAGSALLDGEIFTASDETTLVTFEFDSGYSVVETSTRRRIEFSGSDTATQIRDKIINAINGTTILNMIAETWDTNKIRIKNTDYGKRVLLGDSVNDSGFIVESSPASEYVYCLGSDLLLPPPEDYAIGDKIDISQDVTLTSGSKLLRIQARFRQPASMPKRETLPSSPSSSTITRYARTGVSDTTEITSPTDFFSSNDDSRSVYISGAGVADGNYKIFKGGYKYDSASDLYVQDAKSAVIFGNGPLGAPGGPTDITGYLWGAHWKINIYFESTVIFSYEPGLDGLKERDILLPDLSINVNKFSGSREIKYELELVETTGT